MKRKRLLLLLALLMTAATGAWAQDTKHRITATLNFSSQTKQKTLDVTLPYATTIGEVYTAITDGATVSGLSLTAAEVTSGTNVSIGEFNEWNTPVTVTADGYATVEFTATLAGNNINGTITLSVASPYEVKLAVGTEDAGNWKATVGQVADQELPANVFRGDAVTLSYGGRLKVKSVTATHDGWNGDLSSIPASALESDGMTLIVDNGTTLKGELDVSTIPYKVVIPDGATVTLAGLSLEGNHVNDDAHRHAGITCLGDATIILADNSENTVMGFYENYPGIYVPEGKKLTIKGGKDGNGKLTASSNGYAAGIGAGWYPASCGNIEIQGGDITATGGWSSAGIGSGPSARCGTITISGGTVTATGGDGGAGIGSGNRPGADCVAINISGGTVKATGGDNGAGIGSGSGNGVTCGNITIRGGTVEAIGSGYGPGIGSGLNAQCGDILITDGVTMTSVTAAKGTDAPYSIGAGGYSDGQSSSCGIVTIGSTVYWENNAAVDEAAATYLAQATIVYPSPFANVTAADRGKMIGSDGKVYNPDAIPAGITAVAMIVYVGNPGKVDASSSTYKGLALALSDDVDGAMWGINGSGPCLTQYSEYNVRTDMNGIANTNTLLSTGHDVHSHAAAIWARNHNIGTHPAGTSEWFLPSAGQWNIILAADAGVSNPILRSSRTGYTPLSGDYWTSTEAEYLQAYYYNFSSGPNPDHKGLDKHVRACIAF